MSTYLESMNSDDVYHTLKGDTLNLRLRPGQMISENEIANSYHVSRTPVRTAFLCLKGEGYIEIFPQKGSFIALLDMQYIKDVIYMHYVFEVDVMKTILEQGPHDDLMYELKSNLQKQLMMIERDDPNPQNFYDVNNQFHYLLFQETDHTKIWDTIQNCQVYYTRSHILGTLTASRHLQLCQEHIEICKLPEEKDLETLQEHMHEHLHGSLKMLSQRTNGRFKGYFIPGDQSKP